MWYRGGEWDLRVEGGRSQSQGWHPDQGPCKGGRQHILIQIIQIIHIIQIIQIIPIIQIIQIIQIQIKGPCKDITSKSSESPSSSFIPPSALCLLSSEPGASIGGEGRWGAGAGPHRLLHPRHRVRPLGHTRQVNLWRAMWVFTLL